MRTRTLCSNSSTTPIEDCYKQLFQYCIFLGILQTFIVSYYDKGRPVDLTETTLLGKYVVI